MPQSQRIAALAATLESDLIRMRRDLHRHPELAFAESRTAAMIADQMTRIGAQVRTEVGGTGVLADLQGGQPGPILLIRAEMDALPVGEATGLDYASHAPGIMHACGHDAHVAAALGVAQILADLRVELGGTVRFCFQPAEELLAGAQRMIAEGAMVGVSRVLGAHVHAPAPFGTVLAMSGPVLAGGDFFSLRVRGRAGHGGMPHQSIDPVYVASQIVIGLQAIVSRETPPGEVLVVAVTSFDGDSAANVVRGEVTLRGNIRWLSESTQRRALTRIPVVANSIAAAYGATTHFEVFAGAPVTINHPEVLSPVRDAAGATGRTKLVNLPAPITATDDWAYYLEHAQGAFLLLGAGGEDAPPHHHPSFSIDERVISLMCEVLVRAALGLLPVDSPPPNPAT